MAALRLAVLALFLACAVRAQGQPSAAANAALAPAHARALREIADFNHLVDGQLEALRRETLRPQDQAMGRQFIAQATREKAYLLTIPVLARHLDEQEAAALAQVYRPRAIQAAGEYAYKMKTGSNPVKPDFTAAELVQVKAMRSTPPVTMFEARRKAIDADLRSAWSRWITAHQRQTMPK